MARLVRLGRDGLQLDGQPFYLLSGVIHYFRYPREEWRELLLLARAGGLNTIDTVIPWNRHEPQPGVFDFEAEADLAAYLDLCTELGLLAIVRPGPYICAEWENGGLPAWLTAEPEIVLRSDDPRYLAAIERWFTRLFAILTPRQYTNGGPIILCQIENEHWASGQYGHDAHQQSLFELAAAQGIEVPQYTCMGALPGVAEFRNGWTGIAEKLLQTRALWPENPLIVSELWSGWFDSWGSSRRTHKSPAQLDRVLQQLLAVGASGVSHWVWAGGTNFGSWGGRTIGGDAVFMVTSYDYDAPVTEDGLPGAKFYVARRQHLLLESLGCRLAGLLADAESGGPRLLAPAAIQGRSQGGGGAYRQLRNQAFSATFLSNESLEGQSFQLFFDEPAAHLAVEVEASSIKPIFANLPLNQQGLILQLHTSRLLGFWTEQTPEPHELLVCYGFAGEVGLLQLAGPSSWQLLDAGLSQVQIEGQRLRVNYWISERPQLLRLHTGSTELRILLLTRERAERLWFLSDGSLLCGPGLVLEQDTARASSHGLHPYYQITRAGQTQLLRLPVHLRQQPEPIELHWEALGVREAEEQAGWQPLDRPRSFDELGCWYGYGWYRAQVELSQAGRHTLAGPWLADRARLLLNGKDCGWLGIDPHGSRMSLAAELSAGKQELRLLVDNLGRFNYGAGLGEHKGLLDTLYLNAEELDITQGWSALWQEALFAGEALASAQPAYLRPDAANVDLAHMPWSLPQLWLLREITARPGQRYLLELLGDRNPGALFLNGVALARFSRHNGAGWLKHEISHLLRPGSNTLALHIQGYAGLPWRARLLVYSEQQALPATWSFRGGISPGGAAPALPGPRFWRARFAYDPHRHGHGPFRIAPYGLEKGQIWLNGHDLGRYWQIGPQESYKLPDGWLHVQNELLIFDETGGNPQALQILALG